MRHFPGRAARMLTTLGVVTATVLAATGAVAGTAPAAPPVPSERVMIQSGADDLVALGAVGVQVMSGAGHRATWARAGHGNLRGGTPVPYNGYFRTGSTTKTYAAVVLLQLVEEGRLDLADPVERWLPGVVAGNGNDGARITVRQLLQHTSGLFNYTNVLPGLDSAADYHAHRFADYRPEDVVALAMKHEPEFAPGTGWSYSNTNFALAGMIIEAVTGQTWRAAVDARIVGPLGLRQTFSPGNWPFLPRPHATAHHQFTPDGPWVDTTIFNPSAAHAAGDVVTTPRDQLRFWQALQGGQLIGPEMLAEMRRTVPATGLQDFLPGAGYGLGIMWLPSRCGGYWSHGGDMLGMSTANGVTDSGGRAVVVSLNSQSEDFDTVLAVAERTNRLVADVLCR